MLPEHIEAAVYARVAGSGDYVRQTTYNRAPTTPGLYNGPFRITGYESGQGIVLEPNANWTGAQPALRRIIVKSIENTAALQANLLSGDVDMAPGDAPALTLDQVLSLRQQYPDRFDYVFNPALTYEHIDLNLANPILADLRVRRALLYAIDRKTLVDKMFEGLQPVADSFVNPLDPMHAQGVAHYSFDPKRAQALLAEAGWTPGRATTASAAMPPATACRWNSAPPPATACANCSSRCCRASGRPPASRSRSRTSRRAPSSARR